MTDPSDRFTIGNIFGALMVTVLCAGLAVYALDEPTGRIARNWQSVAFTGVAGTLVGIWTMIKGIRSRRR